MNTVLFLYIFLNSVGGAHCLDILHRSTIYIEDQFLQNNLTVIPQQYIFLKNPTILLHVEDRADKTIFMRGKPHFLNFENLLTFTVRTVWRHGRF